NKQWIWLAMDATTRQIIAFHVGDRSRESAKALWSAIPEVYQEHAIFHTDQYEVYRGVIPAERHKAITKQARKTNHIERFNNTLRQRLARLVRATLSFSKKVENHIGAIKFFICHYNPHVQGVRLNHAIFASKAVICLDWECRVDKSVLLETNMLQPSG